VFPKAEALAYSCRQSAVSTETAVKVATEADVEARAQPVKCNTLFSDGQEKSQNPKYLKRNVRVVDCYKEEDESLLH
jgi:hypothetical protein